MAISSNQEDIFGDGYQSCICSKEELWKWQNIQISRYMWSRQGTFWLQVWGHRAPESHFLIHHYTAFPHLSIFYLLTMFSTCAATSLIQLMFFPYFFSTKFMCWTRALAVKARVRGSSCKSREKSRRKQTSSGGMNHPLEVSVFLHGLWRGSGFLTEAPHSSGMNLGIGVCILLHTRQPLSW